MKKRESEVPLLLLGSALLILALSFASYTIMDMKYYENQGDAWKEFWLPVGTSMIAAVVTFIVAFIFLRSGRANERIDFSEQVSDQVLEKLKERLAVHSASVKHEAQVDTLFSLIQRMSKNSQFEQPINVEETIKDPSSSNRRSRKTTDNK